MAALTSQTITAAGITPSAVAVSSSDTIAATQFGTTGVILRVINGGASPDNVTISDPGKTALGNPGQTTAVAVANGTSKEIFIPTSAIDPTAQTATVSHSFTTSVTCEVKRI